MKSNVVKYGLIACLVIIWILIIQSILDETEGSEDSAITSFEASKPVASKNAVPGDSLTLIADYRDPFLGKVTVKKRNPKPVVNSRPKVPTKKEPATPLVWPSVKYQGLFENKEKTAALVSVSGHTKIAHKGDVIDSVTIKLILADSIKIEYKNQTKYVSK